MDIQNTDDIVREFVQRVHNEFFVREGMSPLAEAEYNNMWEDDHNGFSKAVYCFKGPKGIWKATAEDGRHLLLIKLPEMDTTVIYRDVEDNLFHVKGCTVFMRVFRNMNKGCDYLTPGGFEFIKFLIDSRETWAGYLN